MRLREGPGAAEGRCGGTERGAVLRAAQPRGQPGGRRRSACGRARGEAGVCSRVRPGAEGLVPVGVCAARGVLVAVGRHTQTHTSVRAGGGLCVARA